MADSESQLSFISFLSENLGFSEASVRILITPILGYVLAYIQRTFLYNKGVTIQHLYVLSMGLSLAYFNYGFGIKHSAVTVLINYLLLQLIGGTQVSVALSFGLNMGYLLVAYALYASDDYDMTWTTPQCIMTLRMIGLAFDLYDGHKPVSKLSPDQMTSCIAKSPSLLEIFAFTYFYGGFFIGPQFPLRRYRDLVHGRLKLNILDSRPAQCVQASIVSLRWGIFYCLVVAVIVPYFPNSYLFTTEFSDSAFIYKLYMIAAWGHLAFVKYCGIFSLFDAVCVMSGLTYNGKDENGKALWDACLGAKAWNYEVSLTLREVVASMNISTNVWAAKYLYKRLKFLGNRYISQVCTMIFMAVWHGWYVGYYITFAFEMAVMNFEAQMTYVLQQISWITRLHRNPKLKVPMYIIRKLWQLEFLGYPLVPFTFLRWKRIKQVHGALYYYPYFLFFGWPVVYFSCVLPWIKRREKHKGAEFDRNVTGDESNGAKRGKHSKVE